MQTFEPMSTGKILDKSFRLYKAHFIRFITIVAIIQIPVSILAFTSQMLFQQGMQASYETGDEYSTDSEMENLGSELSEEIGQNPYGQDMDLYQESDGPTVSMIMGIVGLVLTVLIGVMGQLLSQAAMVKSVSEVYLGRDISVKEAYQAILPRIWILIGASILVGLTVAAGFMLLIVPGIIFGLWFALTTQCIVLENEGVTGGMGRSRSLVKGNLGKVFAVGFLASIIVGIIGIIVALPLQAASAFLTQQSIFLGQLANTIGEMLGNILGVPISAAAIILLYYDLRIRKEGFDLEMLAQNLESMPQ